VDRNLFSGSNTKVSSQIGGKDASTLCSSSKTFNFDAKSTLGDD